MDPATVGLFTAGIGLARDVLHYVLSDSQGPAGLTQSVTVVRERTLDQGTLKRVIEETNRHLANLLDLQTERIVDEIRKSRARDAVQELQARVSSLRSLISTKVTEKSIALQLVISALNPLQVSLEVAKYKLQDIGDNDAWQVCYLVGNSALAAGYAFLGEDVTVMIQDLQSQMLIGQKKILNVTARKLILNGDEFPWEKVPRLLSPEGAEDLLALFQEHLTDANRLLAAKQAKKSVAVLKNEINATSDANSLMRMAEAERSGKKRSNVLVILEKRLREIESRALSLPSSRLPRRR